jgi:hypothetical protein
MGDEITGYSLRDVCDLLEEQKADTRILNGASLLLDAAILLSPAYAGPDAAATLLGLLEAKNALVGLGEAAIKWFAKPPPEDYSQQAARLARAHCLLTYTAYFDALQRLMPGLMKQVKLTKKDRERAGRAKGRDDQRDVVRVVFGASRGRQVPDVVISVPHPADPNGGSESRMALYHVMGDQLLEILSSHDAFWAALGDDERAHVRIVVTDDIPALANQVYRDSLVGLAGDYPQFLTWLLLSDQEMKTALLGRITTQLQ